MATRPGSKKYPYTIEYHAQGSVYNLGSKFFVNALNTAYNFSQSRFSDVVLWKEGKVLCIISRGQERFADNQSISKNLKLIQEGKLNTVEDASDNAN